MRPKLALRLAVAAPAALAVPAALALAAQPPRLRGEIEKDVARLEADHQAAPKDPAKRRAYAAGLYLLGDVWRARDLITPLASAPSADPADLALAARLAYLAGDYGRAEPLFDRLGKAAGGDSAKRTEALEGLAMVYYQTNRFDQAAGLTLTGEGEDTRGAGNLVTFMKRFPGKPYGIEWASPDHVAHVPMINDIEAPGALPTMTIEINGHPVNFILDTGGDRLYLDEGLAEPLGIKVISKRRSKYAYTGGKYVDEPLGVADRVVLGQVTLRNVPVIVAKWKALGLKTDGVVTTQMLKQFLATVDYGGKRITLRERSERGRRQLVEWLGGSIPVEMPFFMTETHLMFAKGSLNGHQGMNFLLDSGLALSLPLVIVDQTVEYLGLPKTPVPGTKFFSVPIESHGLGPLVRGGTQAVGNVLVEENPYTGNGFLFDALLSHQFLWHLGSWTIDFDAMKYYFPATRVP
jgi:hypothetical protein